VGFTLIWKTVVDDPVAGTDTFYFKGVTATAPIVITALGNCELNWSLNECVPCYPDHSTGTPGDKKEYWSVGVDDTNTLHYVEVTPNLAGAFPQVYLPTQASDGDLSYANTQIAAPPSGGYNYYAISQDATGDVTWTDLATVLDAMGYVSTSVVP